MHPALVQKMVEGARQRSRDGVDITAYSAPFSPEQYEDCIEALAGERDRLKAACQLVAKSASYSMDMAAVEACRAALKPLT